MQPRNQDVDLDLLEPHPKNYNRHPAEQVRRLAKSLAKFGQVRSVVVWRNTLLAGHGVAEAARILNWRTVRADVLPDDYPEHLALAYIAADNELAKQGDPDMAQLAAILEESKAADADLLEAIGYSDKEFEALLAEVGKGAAAGVEDAGAQVDKAEELRQKWQTAPGQLWQLGEHRLICGDCTDPATVARVMGGERAALVFTDPPYNVASEGTNFAADAPTQKKTYEALKNAEWDKDFDIKSVFPVLESVMADDCAVYVCTSHWLLQRIFEWMWGWSKFCSYVVWCKPNPAPSLAKRHWTWATELIPYAVRGRHTANFPTEGHALSWWAIVSPSHTTDHPTEKPVAVPIKAIEFSSNRGDIIFDGFLGSGTTLIACENLGRKCRACEKSPGYVAVTLQRFQDTFGKTPVLVEAT